MRLVDGNVTVNGDANILANEIKNGVNIRTFFSLLPSVLGGVAVTANSGTSSTGNLLTDAQKVLTDMLTTKLNLLGASQSASQPQAPQFSFALAVGVDMEVNDVTARIGDKTAIQPATVEVGGNLTIDAHINDRPNLIVSSAANGPDESSNSNSNTRIGFAGSVAVALGFYTNTSTAFIEANSTVDAGKTLSVTTEALNDYQFMYGVNLVQALEMSPNFHTNDGTQQIQPGNIVDVVGGATGNGTVGHWYQYNAFAPIATINLSTENFATDPNWTDLGPGWLVEPTAFSRAFTTYLDNASGIDNNFADTWSQATINAGAAEVGVDGSLTVLQLTENSNAYIATGALINQNTVQVPRSGRQNVNIVATLTNSSVNLGGSLQFPGFQGNPEKKLILDPDPLAQNPLGGNQAANVIGPAVVVIEYLDDATATIDTGVTMYADSLNVDAETSVTDVSAPISGEQSSNFGFNGIFSLVTVKNQTLAQIAKGAVITVGSGAISANDSNSVDVHANDKTIVVNIAGGFLTSKNLGFGASVAMDQVARDTEAFIGDPSATSAAQDSGTTLTSGAQST